MSDPPAPAPPSGDPERHASRVAVTAVFLAHGLLFASWTAHIPHVKAHLQLSDGTLGVALLGAPVGAVSALLLAGYLLPRFGSRQIVQVALIGYCATGPIVGLTGSLLALFAALFVWGAFQGALDVSMNTQAVAVERARNRRLMSGLHGSWSIGSFAGAGIGALAVSAGITLTPQLLVLGTIALLGAGLLTVRMLPDTAADHAASAAGSAGGLGALATVGAARDIALLGAIAFAGMLCEGATADWSSVYVSGPLHATGVIPGLAYAAFCLVMVAVRLSGNRLAARFRTQHYLPALAAVASIGFGAALVIGRPVVALFGFGCLAVGLASIIPAVFSAAGRIPGLHPGRSVAKVSACGWAGFVFGPPLIGRLASWTTLPIALGLLPVLCAFLVVGTAIAPGLRTAAADDDVPLPVRFVA